ncbi:putative transcription factor bHLH041 [Oryza brachyantha]|uniref:putative transcription factor bHLH041 n=1 Tax=Oryza brachyantha TaxID=4533 RepID=UPI001ADAF972|nr:putative transcription factor bHLH041 [Oryza brachyantha]
MEDVWCSLEEEIAAGIQDHQPPPPDLHDPSFWPAFAECAASFIAGGDGDNACFAGVADVDLMGDDCRAVAMDDDGDGGFFVGEAAEHLMLTSSPSSLSSSRRSLSIDSAGSMSSFSLDAAAALSAVVPQYQLAPPGLFAPAPADDHDDAIMRAMMAVISSASASPSSSGGSASSPTPFSRDSAPPQPAMAPQPHQQTPRAGSSAGHVVVKSSTSSCSSSILAVPPEKAGGRGQQPQPEEARAAAGNNSQLYHMMSERKRREKLNDSFHTLRSLLPPCSKKDKTTVLINAAKYLKTLEAEITGLEGKNSKLEQHIDGGGGLDAAMRARRAQQRAKVQISKEDSPEQQLVNLTVMVMVECDVVELVLHILGCLRWMKHVSVLSVDADTYSPQLLLKAIASIKLHIMGGDWNEASFHEAMTKAANDATLSCAPHRLALTA